MGLGNWLANARLSLHGYTPEVIEAQRAFLQEQAAEREARAEHARLVEERQAEAASRAKQADIDRAAEAAEKKRADALAAVEKQLELGVPPAQLMRSSGVGDADVTAAIERVYFRKQRAQEEKDAAADQANDAKVAAEERAAARQSERDTARDAAADARAEAAERRRREREDGKPKPDPILDRATKLVQASEAALSMTPDQVDEASRALADRMRARGSGQPAPAGGDAAADVAVQKAVATLPPADRAKFDAILASGDQARIAEAKRRLLAAVGGQ